MNPRKFGTAACTVVMAAGGWAVHAQVTAGQALPVGAQSTSTSVQALPVGTQSTSTSVQAPAAVGTQTTSTALPAQSQSTGSTLSGQSLYNRGYLPASALQAGRRSDLNRSVDVNLRDSTVRQAAQALTRASGITIEVDSSVPADLRLTVEAQDIPLATVLEAIATQANVMIAPAREGVVLKNWPSLLVNGHRTYYKGVNEPWSDEWQAGPAIKSGNGNLSVGLGGGSAFGGGFGQQGGIGFGGGGGFGQQGGGGFGGGGGLGGGGFGQQGGGGFGGGGNFAGQQDGAVTVAPAPGFANGVSGYNLVGGRFTMAAMGDRLVIAEPGIGPLGESGVILTVYQWDNSRQALRRVSSLFHRSEGAPRRGTLPRGGTSRDGGQPVMPQPGAPPSSAFGGGNFGRSNKPATQPGVPLTPVSPAPELGVPPVPTATPESGATPVPTPIAPPPATPAPEAPGATPVPSAPPATPAPEDPGEPL